ncbi:MAG: uL15 family ribosomal protein [Clostridia bacterium]|nr:uL15 family ribosomal protein [Clostridia bacterium]
MNILSVLLADALVPVIITLLAVLSAVLLVFIVLLIVRGKKKAAHEVVAEEKTAESEKVRIPEENAKREESAREQTESAAEAIGEPIPAENSAEVLAENPPLPEIAPMPEPVITERSEVSAAQPSTAVPAAPLPPLEGPVPDNAKVVFAPVNRLVSIRYDKSFLARLIQTTEVNKEYYSRIKNELLRYHRVHARVSWRQESFRLGRELVAKMEIRGKTLCLYLALNPADYAESKFLVEDASDKKKNLPVPTLYRIKNERRARYAIELIADVFKTRETKYKELDHIDYENQYPYRHTTDLVEEGLVKIIEERTGGRGHFDEDDEEDYESYEEIEEREEGVSVAEAEREMRDDEAEKLVRESGNVSMRGKQTIVNVDTLGEYFSDGETVTLDDMKERIPFLNKSATYVKVLARGRLSKALVVEADDFSLAAVKMIALAGGTVYKKRMQ